MIISLKANPKDEIILQIKQYIQNAEAKKQKLKHISTMS